MKYTTTIFKCHCRLELHSISLGSRPAQAAHPRVRGGGLPNAYEATACPAVRIPAPQPTLMPTPQLETEASRKRKADEIDSDMGKNSPRRPSVSSRRMSLSSRHPLPSSRHPLSSGRPPLPSEMPAPLPSMLAPVPGAHPPNSMTWSVPYRAVPQAPVGSPQDISRKNLCVWWQFLPNERWSTSKEIPTPQDAPALTGDNGLGVIYNVANSPGDFMTTFPLVAVHGQVANPAAKRHDTPARAPAC